MESFEQRVTLTAEGGLAVVGQGGRQCKGRSRETVRRHYRKASEGHRLWDSVKGRTALR